MDKLLKEIEKELPNYVQPMHPTIYKGLLSFLKKAIKRAYEKGYNDGEDNKYPLVKVLKKDLKKKRII